MDPATLLAFALKALEAMPTIVNTVEEATTYVENTVSSLKTMQAENRDPTQAEWDALDKTIEDLRAARPKLDE